MGTKRSYTAVDAPTPQESAGEGIGQHDTEHQSKRRKRNKHKAREGTTNWVKKRARTIERRFQRDQDLPADVRNDLERELLAHQKRILEERDKKQRNKLIQKYHMVRFFERKKAERLEKQLRRQLEKATDPEEVAAIRADIHIAQVDVHYTKYFPFMERYVGLYSQVSEPMADEKAKAKIALHSPRPPLWSAVEEAMQEGQRALERLQNRRPGTDSRAKPPPGRPSKQSFAPKAQSRKTGQDQPANGARAKPTWRHAADGVGPTRGQAKAVPSKQPEPDGGVDGAESDSDDGAFFEED